MPEAKADPALRRFELRRLRVPLGGGFLNLVVPEARRILRSAAVAEATRFGQEPPYWARIWPASIALARFVRQVDCRGLRAVDLGCGLGVAGMAAGLAGAAVTFADRDRDALAFAAWNAERAGLVHSPSVQELDWSKDHLAGSFDVILLADVSYARRHHAGLRAQIAAALAIDGVVVHADPDRPEAERFLADLAKDLSVHTAHTAVRHDGHAVAVRLAVAAHSGVSASCWFTALAAKGASA